MKFIWLTRPDGSRALINLETVDRFVPATGDHPELTKIKQPSGDQLVKETLDQIAPKLGVDA